ncbi:MAG: serine protease [Bradyrhizobiaceae bacterium]|nr:serine protease [Bradyrhizobiaceae bacterium]
MKIRVAFAIVCGFFTAGPAIGQELNAIPQRPRAMEQPGAPLSKESPRPEVNLPIEQLGDTVDNLPLAELRRISKHPITEASSRTRSAKDADLYKTISPSVVLIVTKTALGSGSLIGRFGEVLTNYHVVRGYSDVGVVFKPTTEGASPTKDDVLTGHVVKYDEIADLALVKVAEAPVGASFLRLGDSSDISVGLDVHAIGHPIEQIWTYTKGIISQYRLGYEWQPENGVKHKADVIQTQTPINPGNSGGPLFGDTGTLLGVNSFSKTGEGLNYAVSVDDVKRFLARSGNRVAEVTRAPPPKAKCEPKLVSRWRSKEENATIEGYDSICAGKIDATLTYFDDQSRPLQLDMDRNHDGRFDVEFWGNRGGSKWMISFWDDKFVGRWTLVGYHDDGSLKPSRFESYAAYRKRLAVRLPALPDDEPDDDDP